jgi:hypothetical protein
MLGISLSELCKWVSKKRRKVRWIVKRFGKYRRKVSWIMKRLGKYGRKVRWIVKRYEKYGRTQVELWNDMKNKEQTQVE